MVPFGVHISANVVNPCGNAWCLDGDRMPEGGKACIGSFEDIGEREGVLRREARHV